MRVFQVSSSTGGVAALDHRLISANPSGVIEPTEMKGVPKSLMPVIGFGVAAGEDAGDVLQHIGG